MRVLIVIHGPGKSKPNFFIDIISQRNGVINVDM